MEVTGALISGMWVTAFLTLAASLALGGILRHNIRRFSTKEHDAPVIMAVYSVVTIVLAILMIAALPIIA